MPDVRATNSGTRRVTTALYPPLFWLPEVLYDGMFLNFHFLFLSDFVIYSVGDMEANRIYVAYNSWHDFADIEMLGLA